LSRQAMRLPPALVGLLLGLGTALPLAAQARPRARDLGIPFDGTPGPLDAITDVTGVEVGQVTIISGDGRLVPGKGPVRTGVTAIFPRGKDDPDPVFAAWFGLNGNGEMTGTTWVEESGFLLGPVTITNTMSVGIVRDAVIAWALRRKYDAFLWALPVTAETWDGDLNDIAGFHVKTEHVFRALDEAKAGPVAEGSVGGGTGMICNDFKGGIGTASRVSDADGGRYTVGVLVQCNYGYGLRRRLSIAGVPVGQEIPDLLPCLANDITPVRPDLHTEPSCAAPAKESATPILKDRGSIVIVVATDAPLLPHQLKRLAKRAALGLGRMGGVAGNNSGDIFIAFSTANAGVAADTGTARLTMLPNGRMDPLFEAVISATEEAITNAMLAAETMTGADGLRVYALPHDRLLEAMKKYRKAPER